MFEYSIILVVLLVACILVCIAPMDVK